MKERSGIITIQVQPDADAIAVVLRKLSLQSGDILVLRCRTMMSANAMQRLNDYFKAMLTRLGLDHNVEVLVLEGDLELHGVISCEKTVIP